jgi:hypothetical protein
MSNEKRGRFRFWNVVAGALVFVVAGAVVLQRPTPLTPTEVGCVGSWAFISPDHPGETCIVYHLAGDRSVREEHYYLTSAWPGVPRITTRGKWGIDANGRLTVEPNDGILYVRDLASGWLNHYFDDGRQAWPCPALTRFYDVKSVTRKGIQLEADRSAGGRTKITMAPFTGNPDVVSLQ